MKNRVTVKEAAYLMGVSEQFVRIALQRDLLPIGCAIQLTSNKWTYYISRTKLENYLNGKCS